MTAPELQPAIVDGGPEIVMNAAALAEAVRQSPLGRTEALARLRKSMDPAQVALIEEELR